MSMPHHHPMHEQDLKPAVATLIYAANRADITELHEVGGSVMVKGERCV